MDWVEPGGEEMYISNNSPSNLKIKIVLFQGGCFKKMECSMELKLPHKGFSGAAEIWRV